MSYNSKEVGMGVVNIKLHHCSDEERQELIDYLAEKQWDFMEESAFKTRELNEEIRLKQMQNKRGSS